MGWQRWNLSWWGWLGVAWAVAWVVVAALFVPERMWWATTLQFIGALVTAVGLLGTYVRSRYALTLGQVAQRAWSRSRAWVYRWWRRLLRKPSRVVSATANMSTMGAHATGTGMVSVDVRVGLNPQNSIRTRLSHLESAVNQLADRMPAVEKRVTAVENDVNRVAAELSTKHQETLQHIRTQIDQLSKRLDETQALDLRWAIFGLFITVVGIALSY